MSRIEPLPLSTTPYATWTRAAGIAARLRSEIDTADSLVGPLWISFAWHKLNRVADYCTQQAQASVSGAHS